MQMSDTEGIWPLVVDYRSQIIDQVQVTEWDSVETVQTGTCPSQHHKNSVYGSSINTECVTISPSLKSASGYQTPF
jgi:hypothetical protein